METVLTTLKTRYALFIGRADRREFWSFVLFVFLASVVAGVLDAIVFRGANTLEGLVFLALIVPHLAVSVRRMHDIDRSGWWLLIGIIPVVGLIVLIVFAVLPGTVGSNRFGPDPRLDVVPRNPIVT